MGIGTATRQVYYATRKFGYKAREGTPETQTDISMEDTTLQIAVESDTVYVDT